MTAFRLWWRATLSGFVTAAIVYGVFVGTKGNDLSKDIYLPNTPKAPTRTTTGGPSGEKRLEAPMKAPDPEPDLPPPTPETDTVGKSPFERLPEELRNQLMNVYSEMGYGNFAQAAHVARDALELAHEYPEWRIELYYYQGSCFEKLGYTYMAIEQYNRALALQPMHRSSFSAMRRISPEFASANAELSPIKATPPKTATSEK